MEIRLIPHKKRGKKHVGTLNGLVGAKEPWPKILPKICMRIASKEELMPKDRGGGGGGVLKKKIKRFLGKTPKLNPKSYLNIP